MNKKLIIVLIIFTVLGAGLFVFLTKENIGRNYKTVSVEKNKITQLVEDVGMISSKNIRRIYGDGAKKIAELPIEVGMKIKKGQIIIAYENNLQLEIEKVEKQIDALEAKYNDALSGNDMEVINNARIEVSKIYSQIEDAQKDKERNEILFNKGAIAQTEFEESVNEIRDLESSLEIAQNSYNKLAKGISKDRRTQYEAEIDVLLLSLKVLEKNKGDYVIYSDIEGIVTAIDTFEGDIPPPGTLIIEIQDSKSKILLIDFMVEDAIKVKPGMAAKISDNKLAINIDGLKVDQVYPKAFVVLSELSVEENRQTIEIGLSKDADELPFGLEIQGQVVIQPPKEVMTVPVGSVLYKNAKSYVKVVTNGELIEREIITGITMDNKIEVKSGLNEGEEVLLNYQED